jgi:hypothetical protein
VFYKACSTLTEWRRNKRVFRTGLWRDSIPRPQAEALLLDHAANEHWHLFRSLFHCDHLRDFFKFVCNKATDTVVLRRRAMQLGCILTFVAVCRKLHPILMGK